ncbi:hypothetical protein CEQ21_05730 [Niallia circulans]|uniref:Uncharacterized protein n=1 Tax=Niallia circulans TaxID=1397 RepID=A0A553STT2_NIACI|nr:hypothetical protein CEQ21_05730 [Niallia circulans]
MVLLIIFGFSLVYFVPLAYMFFKTDSFFVKIISSFVAFSSVPVALIVMCILQNFAIFSDNSFIHFFYINNVYN